MKLKELRSVEPKDSLGMFGNKDAKLKKLEGNISPLPNSDYYYAIVPSMGYGAKGTDEDVCLLSPDKQLIGILTVQISGDTAYVMGLEIDHAWRNKGLATSLYGILLSIEHLDIVSDSSQTPGGARTWVRLSKIPGVEVRGLVYNPTPEQIEMLGASKFGGTSYTFPVSLVNNHLVPSASEETDLYSSAVRNDFKLIALYNTKGKQK
jgi:hypothetical protein